VLNLIAIAALMSTLDESCALRTHHNQAARAQIWTFGLIVMRFQGSLFITGSPAIKVRICGRTAGSI
jgi:hypothetical protein